MQPWSLLAQQPPSILTDELRAQLRQPGLDFELRADSAGAAGGAAPGADGLSRAKSASRSLRRTLKTPQVNPGSLYRCGKRT